MVDRPYVSTTAVSPPAGLIGINTTLTVTLTAGRSRSDLLPSPHCCFINHVQVKSSFVNQGSGQYSLTYTVRPGDSEWTAGNLSVVTPLLDPLHNLSAVVVTKYLASSPGGDPIAPHIILDLSPGPVSPLSSQPIHVSCPTEAANGRGCTFRCTLHVEDVEIVSPGFMYQRQVGPDQRVVAQMVRARLEADGPTPEEIVFDKAEAAERVDEIRREAESVAARIKELEGGSDSEEAEGSAEDELEQLRERQMELGEELAAIEKERQSDDG